MHSRREHRKLAPLFIIICTTAIPVVGLQSLVAAEHFAVAFASGACFAIFMAWVSWLVFPKALPPRAAPKAVPSPPALALRIALLGTAILAPLMLAYLMMGLYTALPVMIGTVMIVASLDFHLGRKQAVLRVVANFAGGVSSVIVLVLLAIHPTLATFTLLVLASALLFGWRISHGDPMAQLLIVACNGYLIVFGTSLHSDSGTFDVWLTRVGLFLPCRPVHDRNDGAALAAIPNQGLAQPGDEQMSTAKQDKARGGSRSTDGPPLGRRGCLRLRVVVSPHAGPIHSQRGDST